MLLEDQVFRNASILFEEDPGLRELLRETFDRAKEPSPFGVNALVGNPGQNVAQTYNQATGQGGLQPNAPNTTTVPKPMGSPMAPMAAAPQPMGATPVNRANKTDQAIQFQSLPTTPANLAGADILGGYPGAPVAPQPQVASAPPQRVGSAPLPQLPQQSQIGAFLSGLGSSDAILPAIGGGIQAVENQGRQRAAQNATLRALINRGVDQDTAVAAVTNPEMMKSLLPALFGMRKRKVQTVRDNQGQERSALVDDYGNVEMIGGAGPSDYDKRKQTEGLKTLSKYKESADEAQNTLAQLGQIETLRSQFNWEGYPLLSPAIATIQGLFGHGAGEGIQSLAAKIQLGFTAMTKGAISDREMNMFAAATPGLLMSDAGAKNVIAAMRAGSERAIQRSHFYQRWAEANNGNLTGADEAWKRYIDENPVVYKNEQGELNVNYSNVENWRNYLPESGGQTQPSMVQPGAPQPGTPSQTQRMRGGGGNPADYGEMRPGMYRDPQDGRWKWRDPNSGQVHIWSPPN